MRRLAKLFIAVALVVLGVGLVGSQAANSASLITAPKVSGNAVLNGTLKVSTGTWMRGSSFRYQWYSCVSKVSVSATVKPAGCSPISGARSSSLKLREALVGRFVLASVKNGDTEVFAASTTSSVKAPPGAVSLAQVTASASPSIGSVSDAFPTIDSVIDVSLGAYSGNPRPTVSFVAWYACDSQHGFSFVLPGDCKIKSAAKRHELGQADLGKYLLAKVTARNSVATKTYYTATSNQVTSAPFAGVALSLSDTSPEIGQTVSAVGTSVIAFPRATQLQQWYRCSAEVSAGSSLGIGCSAIADATGRSYLVSVDDLGSYLVFSSRATNNLGTLLRFSASSALIESAPVQTSTSGLSGFADVGETITASAGEWYAYPQANTSYEWFICDALQSAQADLLPDGCTQLSGETLSTLTITNGMLGSYLLAGVTVSNLNGTVTVYTASSSVVNIAPKNVVAPFISGTARVGDELVASSGTWEAEPAPTFEYQWWVCDSAISSVVFLKPADCTAIALAVDSTFTPTQEHTGKYIALSVTALNDLGDKEIFATSVAAVRSLPVLLSVADFAEASSPVNPNASFTAQTGSWSAYPAATFSYEWYDCSSVDSCVLLAETGSVLDASELTSGHLIKFKVIATNDEGSASTWSTSALEMQEVPSLSTSGSISGNAYEGETLTLTASTFAGYPTLTTTRQWYACDAQIGVGAQVIQGSCSALGETGLSLQVNRLMQGKHLSVLEQVTNHNGSAHVWISLSVAAASKPLVLQDPVVSGTTLVGSTLSVSSGSWSGLPAPGLSYLWYRCPFYHVANDTVQDSCEPTSVTGSSYQLTAADIGGYFNVRVTATNVAGTATRFTATTGTVRIEPSNLTAPSLSGAALVGSSLVLNPGTWSGYPTPTLTYAWYSCTSQVLSSSTSLAAGCSVISGSAADSLTLTSSQAGKYVLASVTAENSAGSKVSYTSSTAYVNQAPSNTTAPSVSGTARSGSSLSVSSGTWSGTPTISYSYLWYSCTSATAASGSLSGACSTTGVTTSTYSLTSANAGKFLVASVTATNSGGTATHYSASSAVITDAPVNTVAPSISGSAFVGQVLTANVGTWSGFPTPSPTYAWYACTLPHDVSSNARAADCTLISGANLSTFTLTATQANRYIEVAVTQTNSAGSSTIWSASTAAVVVRVTNTAAASYTSSNPNGELLPGDELIGSVGTWTGSPTYTYSWLRCDAAQTAGSALPSGCSLIADETASTYVVTDLDVTSYIVFSVLASNSGSSATSYSSGSIQVVQDIAVVVQPTSSSVAAGTTTIVNPGTWEGYPATTVDAAYEICGVIHTNLYLVNGYETCQAVTSNGNSVDIPADATGKYLRVTFNAYNDRQNIINTYSFGKITGAPAFAYLPVITGRPQIDQVATVGSVNVWSFPNSAVLTYAWFSCAQQYSTVQQVQSNCTNVTQVSETTTHTTLASEAGRYQVAVVTATSGVASSSLSTWALISPATDADIASAVVPHAITSPLNCSGSNAFNCALNLGSSNFTKLVFGSGTIGAVANLTGTVVFDQTRDQLTFTVTNSTATAQLVDLNTLITNSDGCTGTVQKTSWWLAAGQTKSVTSQQATLGSFDIAQNCTFGFNLNSMLIAYITVGNNGSTTALASAGFDWVEGYFAGTCLMNVKTQRYTICQNATTTDMFDGNEIAVASTIIWDSSANTLTYSITNNSASTVYVRMRYATTGLCRPTLPASILAGETSINSGVTYPRSKPYSVTLSTTYTQYEFDTDAFFTGARADCSITDPGVTAEYPSLVATVSVSSVAGY